MKTPRLLSQALLSALVLLTFCVNGFSAAPPVESPFGYYFFESPADPPSGPALITPMAFLNGPYDDPFYGLGAKTFMTMDASGKVKAVSEVPGFADKKEGTQVTRYLFVRTVNGIPILTANAAAGGMYDDGVESPTSGSGKALIPLGPADAPAGGVQEVGIMYSFSGKRDKNAEKEPLEMNTVDLDVNQLGGVIEKDWSFYLDIFETTNPKTGAHYYVADVYFYNPNGTRTYFAPKTVKYSATTGYSVSFSSGKLYNSSDLPINDAHGRQVVDKNSSIKFTNLLFKKFFGPGNVPFWEPAAGGVNYKFLGQNGFGHVFNFDITRIP